jgi:tetratricopeptide (TPR) repeat protein
MIAAVEKEMDRAFDDQDTASFRELEAVVPHAEWLVVREDLAAESAITIATDLGRHHGTWGRYLVAKSFFRDSLSRSERTYAPGHPTIARSQSNLATVLQDLGELEDARDLLRKALASAEASYTPGHPFIANSQSNLAAVLGDLGELEEARDLLRKALASDEASCAPGHPSIAIRQSNLAGVLKDLGKLEEARDLLRKALASDEASYASGHPSIARSQSNLATVLGDLGELKEARNLARKALASDEASYAPGHPSIATKQSNLALALLDLGELEEGPRDRALPVGFQPPDDADHSSKPGGFGRQEGQRRLNVQARGAPSGVPGLDETTPGAGRPATRAGSKLNPALSKEETASRRRIRHRLDTLGSLDKGPPEKDSNFLREPV